MSSLLDERSELLADDVDEDERLDFGGLAAAAAAAFDDMADALAAAAFAAAADGVLMADLAGTAEAGGG